MHCKLCIVPIFQNRHLYCLGVSVNTGRNKPTAFLFRIYPHNFILSFVDRLNHSRLNKLCDRARFDIPNILIPVHFSDFCRHEKAHNICALRGCINEPPHQSTATLYIKNPQKSSNIGAVLCPEKPCTFQSKDDRSALRAFILPQKSETLYSTIIVLNAL